MYAYRPLSIWALENLLWHEVYGQTARFQRHMANLMEWVASGTHTDREQSPQFKDIADRVYQNPFEMKKQKKQPKTRKEIEAYIYQRLTGKELA